MVAEEPVAQSQNEKPRAQGPVVAAEGRVSAEGVLSATKSKVGDTLRFWINIHNLTSKTVCTLKLRTPKVPGYENTQLEPATGDTPQALGCPNPAAAADGVTVSGLRSGQSIAIQGTLKAAGAHDLQNVEAFLSWVSLDGAKSQTIVVLGENQVEADSIWKSFWQGLYEGLKDFALPIMLAVMTYYFGKWDKEREDARQAAEAAQEEKRRQAENKREQARKEAERIRTWQAETWKQMLPKSHDLAKQHYVPIAGSIEESLDAVWGCLQEADPQRRGQKEREAFYEIMVLGARVRGLKEALFFKDRVGEMLAARCFGDYLSGFFGSPAEESRRWYGQATDLCRPETKAKKGFMRRFEAPPPQAKSNPVWECWCFFQGQYSTPAGKAALTLLAGFHAVLTYEMNRPYEHWYQIPEKLVLQQDAYWGFNVEGILNRIAAEIQAEEGIKSDFAAQTRDYLARGKGELLPP